MFGSYPYLKTCQMHRKVDQTTQKWKRPGRSAEFQNVAVCRNVEIRNAERSRIVKIS